MGLSEGRWRLFLPDQSFGDQVPGGDSSWEDLAGVFGEGRVGREVWEVYKSAIRAQVDGFEAGKGGGKLGCCILEPVVQGAGGMVFVDPLF